MTPDDKAIEAAECAYLSVASQVDTRAMRAAIAAYERAMWQPIEKECPTDGRFLLNEGGRTVLADRCTAYGAYLWRRCGGSSHNFTVDNPTHWRPLPPPPGEQKP